MCGIVGYLGQKAVVPVLVDGLKRLECRGYDSASIAVANGGLSMANYYGDRFWGSPRCEGESSPTL